MHVPRVRIRFHHQGKKIAQKFKIKKSEYIATELPPLSSSFSMDTKSTVAVVSGEAAAAAATSATATSSSASAPAAAAAGGSRTLSVAGQR